MYDGPAGFRSGMPVKSSLCNNGLPKLMVDARDRNGDVGSLARWRRSKLRVGTIKQEILPGFCWCSIWQRRPAAFLSTAVVAHNKSRADLCPSVLLVVLFRQVWRGEAVKIDMTSYTTRNPSTFSRPTSRCGADIYVLHSTC
eukprot:scaffold342426_cov17-Prasinocladus_malaysianus.AAC.1